MMFHDKLKFLGTLFGVVFAVILSNQAIGTMFGLFYKNAMLVRNAGADLWIAPLGTENFGASKILSLAALFQAKVTPGVLEARPLLFGAAPISLPDGGRENVSLVGVAFPYDLAGPWNIVAGERQALSSPDTMFFEDSQREILGGLNLGSVRELAGRRVIVGGFTWGLSPFTGPLAFADYDLARELLHAASDQTSFVVVRLEPGASLEGVRQSLRARLPDAMVLTKDEFDRSIVHNILTKTPIGFTFGTIAAFGLFVGLVIVSLAMFSSVLDNVREFGTLKALGATMLDLTILILVQASTYAVFGSIVGQALIARIAVAMRNPNLALVLPPWLAPATSALMLLICVAASMLALLRLRSVEPAMVFR